MSTEPRMARSSGAEWYLGNAEEQNRAHPRSFFIPSKGQREKLAVGDSARLSFFLRDPTGTQPRAERMWVTVSAAGSEGYVGELTNRPVAIPHLHARDQVQFGPEHVIAINDPRWHAYEDQLAFVNRRLLEDDDLEPRFVVHDPSDQERPPRPDGQRASGWQLLVGDETDDDLANPENLRVPNLAWLMERYPMFAALVFSGASAGEWLLDQESRAYEPYR